MSSADSDPLEGADIGETVHVEQEETFRANVPLELIGNDRLTDAEVVDIELTDDREVTITWEADLTKTLPRRWDECREPRTDAERKQARRRKWARKLAPVATNALVFAIASAVAYRVMRTVSGEITINDQPMTVGGPVEILGPMFLIALLVLVIGYGFRGWLPRRTGGARQ